MFWIKKTVKGFKCHVPQKDLVYVSDALDLALRYEFNEDAFYMLQQINKKLKRGTWRESYQ